MATITTKNPDGSTTVNDGTYGGSPTAPSKNSTVLDTASLTPTTTSIPYVAPTPTKTDVMGPVDAAAGSVDSFIKSMTSTTQQPTESVGDTLSKQIAGLTAGTENQTADQAAAEKQMGVDTKLQELQTAQNNVNLLSANYKKSYATLWDRNKPIELLSGEQNALKAQAEADIGFAQAEVLAKKGDIETAQLLAKRSVDAKYAPTLAAIDTKKKQLEALKPILDKEGAIRVAAQTAALDKIKKAEDNKAANEANFTKLKIDASAGGINALTLEKASQAFKDGKEDQAYALLGPYGKAALERKQILSEINKNNAAAIKSSSSGISSLSTGPISAEAQGYVDLINKKVMSLDDVLTKLGSTNASRSVKAEIVRAVAAMNGTPESITSLLTAKTLVDQMVSKNDYTNAGLGSISGVTKYNPLTATSYADAVARASQLNALLAKDNLGLLKGAMSDNDLKFIKDMSGGAVFDVSEEYAKERIESIQKSLSGRISNLGLDGSGQQSTQTKQSSIFDEGDTKTSSTPLTNMAKKGYVKTAPVNGDVEFNLPTTKP